MTKRFSYTKQHLTWMGSRLDAKVPRYAVAKEFFQKFGGNQVKFHAVERFVYVNFPRGVTTEKAISDYFKRKETHPKRKGAHVPGKRLFYYTPDHIDWMAERVAAGQTKNSIAKAFVEAHRHERRSPSEGHVRTVILPKVFPRGADPRECAAAFRSSYKTRGEIRREIEARMPPEKRNRVAIANALLTHRERSAAVRRGWARLDTVKRKTRIANISTNLSPEKRSQKVRDAWVTRRITGVGAGRRGLKRRSRKSDRPKLPASAAFEEGTVVPVADLNRELVGTERMERLADALSSLTDVERKVLELRVLQDMKLPKVCSEMGLNRNEILRIYKGAIDKLRRNPLIRELI